MRPEARALGPRAGGDVAWAHRTLARVLTSSALGTVALTSAVGGQVTAEAFDVDRAMLMDEQMFAPYVVDRTRSLEDALDAGILEADTPLLVFADDVGELAFLTQQLAYHHVAQGEIDGEPWMVSF